MRKRLTDGQILEALALLPDWAYEDNQIQKTYKFGSYNSGLIFAVVVGHLAETLDHHPDMTIGYRQVKIALSTHDAGGVTQMDVTLAGNIEALHSSK